MFIQDGIKFVQNFAGIISESTPHLYLSGLSFLPPRSALANMLIANFPNIAQVARGQHENWPSNQHVLRGHTSFVNSVAFSWDGRQIVSGSWDQTIRVWDAQTGAQVGNPLQGHTNSVLSVAFSPDGRHIVSGSWDQTIQVWDAQTGAQVGNPLQGHRSVPWQHNDDNTNDVTHTDVPWWHNGGERTQGQCDDNHGQCVCIVICDDDNNNLATVDQGYHSNVVDTTLLFIHETVWVVEPTVVTPIPL